MRVRFDISRGARIAALTLLSLGAAQSGQASDAAIKDLQRIERRGLDTLGSARIEQLLRSGNTPTPVISTKTRAGAELRETATRRGAPSGREVACLSEALYFEARGETLKGQYAVAEVILNRVRSERFPDTVCGVINQGTGKRYQCQFTYTCDGKDETIAEPDAYEQVQSVAQAVLSGDMRNLTDGATHYHTTSVKPGWSSTYTRTAKIGTHVFYRHNYRTASN